MVCTLELDAAVDSDVRVTGVWRRAGETLSNSSRISISETTLIGPSVYETTISISPLSDSVDSGQYSCQSAIMSSPFVRFTSGSQQVTVNIEGTKYFLKSVIVMSCDVHNSSSTAPYSHNHQ